MKFLRNIILLFSIFYYSSLQAEIVKSIVIEGNKRVSTETIKIYGGIEINKDYKEKALKCSIYLNTEDEYIKMDKIFHELN